MDAQKITILGEMTDLNSYIGAINGNRYSGNQVKRSETKRAADEALSCRARPIESYPVVIVYRWYSKNKRKDVDNISFAKKFINDGLVAAGVLKNDSQKYVSGLVDKFYVDKENPRVEVIIFPADSLSTD